MTAVHTTQVGHQTLVLPAPPSDDEKRAYLHRDKGYLGGAILAGSLSLLFCQIGFEVFASPWLFPITILLAVSVTTAFLVMLAGPEFNYTRHRRIVRACRRWPSVDVFLPIAGEPLAVLDNTWRAVAAMGNAYPGDCYVFVLDDGASPQARDLAKEYGFVYVVRPDRGRMRKAGNLRYAYAHTGSRLIAIFDADFAPRSDYLYETVPYFTADPDLGILQTPQFFRTDHRQTWVERAGNATQEVFYRNIQPARDYFGASVTCGTCAVYRRRALEPDGGFAEVPYAEDEHTGLNVREHGWQVRYIPVCLAAGMSPETVDGYVRQQYRWCSGTFSTMRRWPRHSGLRLWFTYASGLFYYLYSAAQVIAGPAVPLALLFWYPSHVHLANYFALTPALIAGLILYPLWHRSEFGPSAWPLALIRGWSHLLASVDFLTGRTMGWQVTGTVVSPVRRLWAGLIGWNCTTAVAWIGLAAWRTVQTGSVRFVLIGLLGIFYACVVGSVFTGRKVA